MANTEAKVVSMVSGKGGVGKSTLSVGLGMAFASVGKKVLLLEFDTGLRGVDIMLGITEQIVYDLGDLLEGRCNINSAIIPSPHYANLFAIVAPLSLQESMRMEDVRLLLSGLRPHFDIILMDTPAGIGSSLQIAALSDLSLIVATPDPVCVRDGNRVALAFAERYYRNHRLVINRVDRSLMKKHILNDLDEVIDGVGSQLIGVLPEDDVLQLATAKGGLLPQKSMIFRVCRAIALRITGEYLPLLIY